MNNKFSVTFEMLSDWHIGTGVGIPGSVDALIARDADGFPCLPAKTIIGIWRDALETLTLGLYNCDEKNKNWQKWVDVIFGSQPNVDKNPNETPRPAILSIQPARIDENLQKAISTLSRIDRTKYKQVLTFIKPNTKIDPNSGTAQTESLRFTETGRIGSVLTAEFELDFDGFDDDSKELVKSLLTTSASFVERIGGNRRRGSGKCSMSADCGITDAVAVLEKYQSKAPEIPEIRRKKELEAPQKANSDEWKRVEYSLKLETPVAIVTATLGNVSETLDFIPGTYLLPHITNKVNGISKYIASGDFQVLPATITVDGKRGLPAPRVFVQEKLNESQVYSKLLETEEFLNKKLQAKPLGEGYIAMENGNFIHSKTPKILLMHNTVEDEVQRPTENVGGVFSRQAIQAGQVLKGEIRFKTSIEKDLDFSKVGGYVRLGTSKKDDYGYAAFKVLGEIDSAAPELKDSELIVYLASDVLLRNGNLRQTNLLCDLKTELEKTLGINSLKCCEKKSLIQMRRIESWHEGWGFPRPTLTAMAAGSVAVFEIENFDEIQKNETKKSELETKLQKIELSGIGERRGEGYGQIRFNPQILTAEIKKWTVLKQTEKPEAGETERNEAIKNLKARIESTDNLRKFVENLEISAWREEIARAVLKIANEPKKREDIFGFAGDIPSMSQIGGLRSAVGKVKLDGSNKNVVTDWLKHLQATSNRKEKWKKGFGKINELFTNKNEVWTQLEAKGEDGKPLYFNPPNLLISDEDILKNRIWAEAVKSLFDACARAHKRATEDNE